jgi:hypothetical protein
MPTPRIVQPVDTAIMGQLLPAGVSSYLNNVGFRANLIEKDRRRYERFTRSHRSVNLHQSRGVSTRTMA